MSDAKLVSITVDGITGRFPEGTRVIDAARDLGVFIPHYCYHEFLPVEGSCRLCLVELDGGAKLQLSCATPVREGMVVETRSAKVKEARRGVMEFLLLNHPLDCPICDKAGECPLQDHYFDHSAADTRTTVPKWRKGKRLDIGARILLDQERCILCGRCVRFLDHVAKEPCLGRFGRGHHTLLDVMPGRRLDSVYSGNTVDICPVGALTWKDFRFRMRPWFLEKTLSVCPHCSAGCAMTVEHENGRVYRLRPVRAPLLARAWMCDPGRLAYKEHARPRAERPLLREDGAMVPAERARAVETAAAMLRGSKKGAGLVLLLSDHLSCEEAFLALRLASCVKTRAVIRLCAPGGLLGDETSDAILRDPDKAPNAAGVARVAGLFRDLKISPRERAAGLLDGAECALLVGPDLTAALDPPARAKLLSVPAKIAVTAREGPFSAAADVLLPSFDHYEKAGTFVNRDGILQRFERALSSPGCRADDLELLAELLSACGGKAVSPDPARVYAALAEKLPGLPSARGTIPAGGVRLR